MLAILALAFLGVLQLVGSGTAQAHSMSHHASPHYQTADLSQPLERQAAVIAPAIGSHDHAGCPGHDAPTSNHHTPTCCGTPCCAAALAAMPDVSMRPGDRAVTLARFYPRLIIADVVFGLDRPPDLRA